MIVGVAFYNRETEMLVTMPRPNRHADIIEHLYKESSKPIRSEWVQGFVTDTGKFLNRLQAAIYAYKCGQMLTPEGQSEKQPITCLFSEDLW